MLKEEDISAYLVLFATLLSIVLICSKLLRQSRLRYFLPDAGMTLLVGLGAGAILHAVLKDTRNNEEEIVAETLLSFSPRVFFLALLPPIIFHSGYHLRRWLFFRHLLPIVLLATIGTLVSAVTIAGILRLVQELGFAADFQPSMAELLTFGGLLSATDPVSTLAVFASKKVDPQLFYLVFGEAVLNDAVGLILFRSFARFVKDDANIAVSVGEFLVGFLLDAVGSPLLGLACGAAAALIFRYVDFRETPLLEVSLYSLIMYVPFLLAEVVHLSGIVTILFTGMTAQAYVLPNLSRSTQDTSEAIFGMAAHLAETSIFLELGLSVFGLKGSYVWPFIGWTCLACLVARAIHVYPISIALNLLLARPNNDESLLDNHHHDSHVEMTNMSLDYAPGQPEDRPERVPEVVSSSTRREDHISASTMHMVWFSGLRGAVAYACVKFFPKTQHARTFVVTTMMVVLLSVFVLGGTTELALDKLGISTGVDEDEYMTQTSQKRQHVLLERLDLFCQRHLVRNTEEDQSDCPDSENTTTKTPTSPSSPDALLNYGKGD